MLHKQNNFVLLSSPKKFTIAFSCFTELLMVSGFNIIKIMDVIAHCLLSNKHKCRNAQAKSHGQRAVRGQFVNII